MAHNPITGSPQQDAIWQELTNGKGHVIVQALAGTGKTTTIVEGLYRLKRGQSAAFVAFNKSIATELQQRVPQGVQACTLHSLGYAAIRQNAKVQLDQDKTAKLLPPLESPILRQTVIKLVSLCKANLLDGNDQDELESLAVQYGIDLNGGEAFRYVPRVLKKSKEPGTIDFDDMIWLPVVWGMQLKKYDVLMVDECQDLNKAQQELIMMAGKRIVLVGDKNQAIYGFRGADSSSMDNMETMLRGTGQVSIFPLTVSRRCPQTVTELAKKIVPTFECLPDAPIGQVTYNKTMPARGEMVLCRTNAPLISMAYSLIRANVPVKVQGRDIGTNLAAFIKKLVTPQDTTIDLTMRVIEYQGKETHRINADKDNPTKNEAKIQALTDKCECVLALAEGLDNVQQVLDRIQLIFADISSTDHMTFVLLSSVHRAKGLETNTVHILCPELMPHPMAKLPWQQQQERNLQYVAYTRAKQVLNFL